MADDLRAKAEALAAIEQARDIYLGRFDGAVGWDAHAAMTAALDRAAALLARLDPPTPDHPHTDPGDGRVQCPTCGKWVWMVTHSCKGVRVAPPTPEPTEDDGEELRDFMESWYDRWAGPGEEWNFRDLAESIVEEWLPGHDARRQEPPQWTDAEVREAWDAYGELFDKRDINVSGHTMMRAALDAAERARVQR